ncbi:S-acyl fatty acid synthase thioesterase, medium chain-like [Lytechinus variegatus]|uniref:S-acyl fatty acid synthase thioesterase, medium chain-like n=1 Tax=Lytechinus variegatus TaxID=7654 RepID=UPI001BB1C2E0|nr:S-acyl fatty acid synthase thioesterase, medium chain-like [Lytechinus variegatus]XP_041478124.1 S-acyl fatty acid synthase thioesterase, medium chain-like [Lytechinus variegatus]XP_041478125.1 S-acyl fatty acid synthase thioesterase, medium chain-like [Lytechinus variegatus]
MDLMEKLTNCRSKRENARYRVFCFPWAGGGSGFYSSWYQHLPEHIEVHGIRLPGRESRFQEPLYRNLDKMVKDIATTLLPKLRTKPFVFFGHSFGALVCYEVTRYLVKNHNLQPNHLIVSGTFGPHSELRAQHRIGWTRMTDKQFVAKLRELGGTPPDVLENQGLMKIFLPSLRADLEIAEQYDEPAPAEPFISCPLTCFNGKDDRGHPPEGWAEATSSKEFHTELLSGGHFFLLDEPNKRRICEYIAGILPNM